MANKTTQLPWPRLRGGTRCGVHILEYLGKAPSMIRLFMIWLLCGLPFSTIPIIHAWWPSPYLGDLISAQNRAACSRGRQIRRPPDVSGWSCMSPNRFPQGLAHSCHLARLKVVNHKGYLSLTWLFCVWPRIPGIWGLSSWEWALERVHESCRCPVEPSHTDHRPGKPAPHPPG